MIGSEPKDYQAPLSGPILLGIVLAGERPASANTWWSNTNVQKRVQYKNTSRAVVRNALPDDIQTATNPLFPYTIGRVDMLHTVYFKGNMQDPDNICLKPYIDGILGEHGDPAAVLIDDSVKYIRYVVKNSQKSNKNPRIEITIRAAFESEAQVLEWHTHQVVKEEMRAELSADADEMDRYGMFSMKEVMVPTPLTKMEWGSDLDQ